MSLVAYASKTKKKNKHLPNLVNAGWLESISWEKGHHQ